MIEVFEAAEYADWLKTLPPREYAQVKKRIAQIELWDHFGDIRNLGEHLFELRWENGRRVYFTILSPHYITLLLGGHKNAQEKEIKKSRLLLKKYANRRPRSG